MGTEIYEFVSLIDSINRGNAPRSPEDLIEKLELFFEGLISLSQKPNSHCIIEITDECKKKYQVNLLDDCHCLFRVFYPALSKLFNKKIINKYISISTFFISSTTISTNLKLQIIHYENQYLELLIKQNGFKFSSNGFKALDARIAEVNNTFDSDLTQINEDELVAIFSAYLCQIINIYISKGQFIQCNEYILSQLKNSVDDRQSRILLMAYITNSNSFCLTSKRHMNELLEEYVDIFQTNDELDYCRSLVNADPRQVKFSAFETGRGKISKNIVEGRELVTVIQFSIPYRYKVNQPVSIGKSDTTITLLPVHAFWLDPMFEVGQHVVIGAMSWSHYCEVEAGDTDPYTHIVIEMRGLFAPDVILEEDDSKKIDFSEKEAYLGRRYYPFKEKSLEILLNAYQLLEKYIEIDKKSININMFSNHLVRYFDFSTKDLLCEKIFALTNPDSYSKTTTNFLERMSSLDLSDESIDIQELMRTHIHSEKNLNDFIYRAIHIFVKHVIEQHGGYDYLWQKYPDGGFKEPLREPLIQPYIYTLLKNLFDFMGIQLSREAASGNGSIDFLASYNNNENKLLKSCVELKLAHSDSIEDGLLKQLPAYQKSQSCNHGVYLVLWFKQSGFDKPHKYYSLEELSKHLEALNQNKKISIISINCSKPTPPSKL